MQRKKKHVWETPEKCREEKKKNLWGCGGWWCEEAIWDPVLGITQEVFSLLDEATQKPRAWICPLLNSPSLWDTEGFLGGFMQGTTCLAAP